MISYTAGGINIQLEVIFSNALHHTDFDACLALGADLGLEAGFALAEALVAGLVVDVLLLVFALVADAFLALEAGVSPVTAFFAAPFLVVVVFFATGFFFVTVFLGVAVDFLAAGAFLAVGLAADLAAGFAAGFDSPDDFFVVAVFAFFAVAVAFVVLIGLLAGGSLCVEVLVMLLGFALAGFFGAGFAFSLVAWGVALGASLTLPEGPLGSTNVPFSAPWVIALLS